MSTRNADYDALDADYGVLFRARNRSVPDVVQGDAYWRGLNDVAHWRVPPEPRRRSGIFIIGVP
jgi:hypothetical protein